MEVLPPEDPKAGRAADRQTHGARELHGVACQSSKPVELRKFCICEIKVRTLSATPGRGRPESFSSPKLGHVEVEKTLLTLSFKSRDSLHLDQDVEQRPWPVPLGCPGHEG